MDYSGIFESHVPCPIWTLNTRKNGLMNIPLSQLGLVCLTQAQWSTSGRGDLHIMKRLGANAVVIPETMVGFHNFIPSSQEIEMLQFSTRQWS